MEEVRPLGEKRISTNSVKSSEQDSKRLKSDQTVTKPTQKLEHVEQRANDEPKNFSRRILKEMQHFQVAGFEATNYIFRENTLEICYILENTASFTEEDLKQKIASHLNVESETLKLTELRAKPVFKETNIRPGESACIEEHFSVGAFVEVDGKGIHALMSGHGKNPGDTIRHENHPLGRVVVSLTSPGPNIPNNHPPEQYRDISLALLNDQSKNLSTITRADGTILRLSEDPGQAVDGMEVSLFTSEGRRGRIDSPKYVRRDQRQGRWYEQISVVNEQGQPIHREGESGVLIVSKAPSLHQQGACSENTVAAVGMLVATEELPIVQEGTVNCYSLAVPMITSFEDLRNDPYCNGSEIKFLQK